MTNRGRMGDATGQPMDVLLAVHHGHDGLAADLLELGWRDAFLQETVNDLGDRLFHHGGGRAGFTCPAAPGET